MKIGKPYQVAGRTYVPVDDRSYDQVGMASWYGDAFHGRSTSNGEIFNKNDITAAHPTLPLPCYVRVTNLENGNSLVVRVNDRGPFHSNRLIDVSHKAAELLGFQYRGQARVRVQRIAGPNAPLTPDVGTNEDGPVASDPPAMPVAPIVTQFLLPPSPEVLALAQGHDAPILEHVFIQVAAVGDETRARLLASRLVPFGTAIIETLPGSAGQIYRVRLGPYPNQESARGVVVDLKNAGYDGAIILSPHMQGTPVAYDVEDVRG